MRINNDWWRGAVIYQIYPRSFFDSDGDGVGDLRGVAAKLEHVARLGADAIWLCPFFASPQKDFGYDVAGHTEIDPLFGTMDDFDAVVDRAHALGLRVLLDQVWSHTSDRHPWFLESRAGRANPKADWFVWADPSPDGTPPNNWLSVFGGSAWTWEPRRRQYYLHHFLASQPALNLHHPDVVAALIGIGRFWLDRGVDGFRLDAIDFMAHDPELRANPPAPPPDGAVPAKLFGLQEHRHDMLHPARMGVIARIRALMDAYPGTVTLGEVSSQPGAFERVAEYTSGPSRLHMAYTLRVLRGTLDHGSVAAVIRAAAREQGHICWAFSNHDAERAISRWNPAPGGPAPAAFARMLLSLLLSLRGSPCVYQGEELGLPEASLAFEQLRDPFGIAYWPEFRGRDGSRTPMPWHAAAPHGGFTDGGTPWLPMPEEHLHLAADLQEGSPGSLLHAWREFIAFRRAHPALVHGSLTPLDLPAPVVGFVRELGEQRILCAFNLSGTDAVASLPEIADGAAPLGPRASAVLADGRIGLEPYGATFLALPAERARQVA
ncbi:MAG: alpha glucosidase [Rhodospirillales bacterium]|nr:alpha glucosidase [Rhodospirillales bacterium]